MWRPGDIFLFQGVLDPLGGINSLWPLFGISNQLLAAIALCVCTTILIKMGKGRFVLVTLLPLVWLVSATMTASYQKIWSPEPALGFLAHARFLSEQMAAGAIAADKIGGNARLMFNDRLDAMVTLVFASLVIVMLIESGRNWWLYASGRKRIVLNEGRVELSRLTA